MRLFLLLMALILPGSLIAAQAPEPNPTGAILAGAMLLEHLGAPPAAADVRAGVDRVLLAGRVRTPDLGGSATTAAFAAAVRRAVEESPAP